MPTFSDLLPPTKTEPAAGFDWTPERPGCGRLVIKQKRVYVTYRVTEFGTPWEGRAFRFEKPDAPGESYDVFCHRGGQDHQCSCAGFAYGRGKPCKHVLTALTILDNGWLDSPVNPESDVANTEAPF